MKKVMNSALVLSVVAAATYILYMSKKDEAPKTRIPEKREKLEFYAKVQPINNPILAVTQKPALKMDSKNVTNSNKVIAEKNQNIKNEDVVSNKTSATISTVKIKKSKNSTGEKSFSLTSTMSAAKSLKALGSESDFISTAFNLNLSYKINLLTSAHAYLGMSKELTGSRDQSLSAAFIGLNSIFYKKNNISIVGKLRTYLPVNKEIREETSFRGRLYSSFAMSAGLDALGLKKVNLSSSVVLAKNFHEFTYTSSGTNNSSIFSTFSLGLDYSPIESISISIYGSATGSWDYEYFNHLNTYLLGESFSYSVGKNFNISVGHEVGGNTFGYDGKELNIDFLDEDNSSIYSSLSYTHSF